MGEKPGSTISFPLARVVRWLSGRSFHGIDTGDVVRIASPDESSSQKGNGTGRALVGRQALPYKGCRRRRERQLTIPRRFCETVIPATGNRCGGQAFFPVESLST